MKITRTQFILTGLAVIAAGTVTAVLVTRARKKKLSAEIIAKISGGVGQFGDYNDIPTMNAFNPAFWRKAEYKQGQTYVFTKAINIAKSLHGYMETNDPELVYILFSAMVSQQQISEVAEAYKTTYSSNLGLDLVDKINNKYLQKIYNLINLLPLYKPFK